MRLRFIFGLKVKSKLSGVLFGSRKPACLRRRSSSSRRSESRSMGHRFGLRLAEAGFQYGGDAAEAG
jgi:hypothetical protein